MAVMLKNFVRRCVVGYKNYLASQARPYPISPMVAGMAIQPMIGGVPSIKIPIEIEKTEEMREARPKPLIAIEGMEIPKFPEKIRIAGMLKPEEEKKKISMLYPLIPKKPGKGEPIFAYARIYWDAKQSKYVYQLVEPEPTEKLKSLLPRMKELLEEKLDIDFAKLKKFEAKGYLYKTIDELLDYYKIKVDEKEKLLLRYFIERDFIGLGKIEPFMNDEQIEDISCDGLGVPLFIFHRNPKLGSVVSNIVFENPDELDSYIHRFAQLCGKSISVASPLVDGALPDGSRVQATLATDIAKRGSNFTIRRFTEEPLTPIHLLNYGTLDVQTLAFLWLAVDFGKSVLVSGGTASGKTTLLNVLSLFIRPERKIISIEDSVTGDCEIIVNRNGRFERTTIGEFIDSQIKKYGSEINFDREVCYLNPDMVSVFVMDSNGKIKLTPVSLFVRHKVKKDIFEIKTRTGRKIKVTGDHSLFCLDENGNIVPTEVRRLGVNSFIAVPRCLPFLSSGVQFINLLSLLEKLDGLFVCGDPIKAIPEEFLNKVNISKSTKKRWLKVGAIPAKMLYTILKEGYRFPPSAISELYLKPCRQGYKLPVRLPLDKEFLTFIGLWLAEGSYDKNSVIISNEDEECREIIRKVGGQFNISVKFHSDRVSLMLNSCVLKRVMNALGFEGNAYTKRIPEWMFNLSNEQLACVLLGDFSGDGYISKYEVERRSSSLSLLKDIQTALLRFGIISRISKFKERDKTYAVRISGAGMLRRFKENINFLQFVKSEKLAIASERTTTHDTYDIVPLSQSFLNKLKKEIGGFRTTSYYYGSNIGRRYLATISADLDGKVVEKASILANSDIFWDEIIEITQLPYTEQYVYDLSVPDFENFVCEGIVAHNTPELKLPHPHWVPHVARVPIAIEEGKKIGEIDLFDLLKESMRQRPDYIIVGEVRGREAYVLFQEMATGHPSLATIHAENLPKLLDRLTTPPISLPPGLLGSLDLVVFLLRVRYKEKHVRKVNEILEVVGVDPETKAPVTNEIFKWNAMNDRFEIVGKSTILKKLSQATGLTEEQIKDELEKRMLVLSWMKDRNIVHYKDVFNVFNMYYSFPERVISTIMGRAQ